MGDCASYALLHQPFCSRKKAKDAASVVPYQGFKTADGSVLIGGANDRLFGILCNKLGKPDLKTDPRFINNNNRVQNRTDLETIIETETSKHTTAEWQAIFEGSGLPYAAVNDVQGTMNHEHGKLIKFPFWSSFIGLGVLGKVGAILMV